MLNMHHSMLKQLIVQSTKDVPASPPKAAAPLSPPLTSQKHACTELVCIPDNPLRQCPVPDAMDDILPYARSNSMLFVCWLG